MAEAPVQQLKLQYAIFGAKENSARKALLTHVTPLLVLSDLKRKKI
jgi:hypothetical protein